MDMKSRTQSDIQGSRDMTMDDRLIHIPNHEKQNYPFCGLKSLVEKSENANLTKQDSVKVPKVLKLTNERTQKGYQRICNFTKI